MKRARVMKRKKQMKPSDFLQANPRFRKGEYDASIEIEAPPSADVPKSVGDRAVWYADLLSREKRGLEPKGTASAFRKEYLKDMLPQKALELAKVSRKEPEFRYKVIEYGEKELVLPKDMAKTASQGNYVPPFSTLGKISRPSGERKFRERKPIPVGPVQKALFIASREATFYRNRIDEEEEGHISVETRRRAKLFLMLSRDLKVLLDMLRAESQKAVSGTRQQKARVRTKHSGILDRAMRMVVG